MTWGFLEDYNFVREGAAGREVPSEARGNVLTEDERCSTQIRKSKEIGTVVLAGEFSEVTRGSRLSSRAEGEETNGIFRRSAFVS